MGETRQIKRNRRSQLAVHVAAACTAFVAVLLLLLVGLEIFGGQLVRGPLEREVTAKTGRALTVESLAFRVFSRTPGMSASGIRYANAPWAERPLMLDVGRVDLALRWRSLLDWPWHIARLDLETFALALERNAEGDTNWTLNKGDKSATRLPLVETLTLTKGELEYLDRSLGTAVHARVEQQAEGELPLAVIAEGRVLRQPFNVRAQGEAALHLLQKGTPYRLQLQVTSGKTHVQAAGSVADIGPDASFQGEVDLRGDNIGDLDDFLEVVLPNTGPYRLSGKVERAGGLWDLKALRGRVGKSDLNGDVALDLRGERPSIVAKLDSSLLDLADLGGFLGAKPGEGERKPGQPNAATTGNPERVLPDKPFQLARLREMDARVELVAKRVARPGPLPLDNFRGKLMLDRGVATLSPVSFGVAGGDITANVRVAIQPQTMRAESDVRFTKLQLDQLLPKLRATVQNAGRIDGSARLTGTGRSFAEMLSTADGKLGVFMRGGEMSSLLTELIGLDAGEAIRYLLGGDRKNVVRCAAAGFDAKNGVLSSNVLVFDTVDTNITGRGQVNLAEESMNVDLHPHPKDVSIGVLRVPIRVRGKFANADVSPDRGALAARAGGALLLGMVVTPLAALLPLIETGGGEDAPCADLLKQVQQAAEAGKGKGAGNGR